VPEQHGSKDVHVTPSRWQQNLPARPLTTVWSHLSLRQQPFVQVRPSFLQRLASAPWGVVTISSDARLAAAARPTRRRVQLSKRGAFTVASNTRSDSPVRDEFAAPSGTCRAHLATSDAFLGL
jgi:hypothetical protein